MNFYIVEHATTFLLKFVGRSKYCLEIFKTWEKLSSSHILYFVCFFKDRRALVWKQNSRGFIDRKRILGILSLLLTYSCTYDFRRLNFPNFITNIKRLLLKKVSLKFLYKENVHQNPLMKVWTNIGFRAAPNLPNSQDFPYYL